MASKMTSSSCPSTPLAITKRRTCLCSPTTHAGSFRCSFHCGMAATPENQKTGLKVRGSKLTTTLFKAFFKKIINPSRRDLRRRRFFKPQAHQLVKLLELREANHIEFSRIKNVADEILQLHKNPELSEILKLLMDPTSVATGLILEFETLVSECDWVSYRIGELISLDGEVHQQISSSPFIPGEFFEDTEFTWKGRVKRKHMEDFYKEVEEAARSLHCAVGFYSSLLSFLLFFADKVNMLGVVSGPSLYSLVGI